MAPAAEVFMNMPISPTKPRAGRCGGTSASSSPPASSASSASGRRWSAGTARREPAPAPSTILEALVRLARAARGAGEPRGHRVGSRRRLPDRGAGGAPHRLHPRRGAGPGRPAPAARQLPLRSAQVHLPARLHPGLRGEHPAEDRLRRLHHHLRADHGRHRGGAVGAARAGHGQPRVRGEPAADHPGDLPARDGADPARVGAARHGLQHHRGAPVRDLRRPRRHRLPHRGLGREPPDAPALRRARASWPPPRWRSTRRCAWSRPGSARGGSGRDPRRWSRSAGCRSASARTAPAWPRSRASTSRSRTGSSSRWSAPAGAASPPCSRSWRACARPSSGAVFCDGEPITAPMPRKVGHDLPGGQPPALALRDRQRGVPAQAAPRAEGGAPRGRGAHARADRPRRLRGAGCRTSSRAA